MNEQPFSWLVTTLRQAAWAPVIVFTVHVLASRVFGIYMRYPGFDIPMHSIGGVAIAYFFHRATVNANRQEIIGRLNASGVVCLVLALVCTSTVLWEFAEFISDRFFGTHAQWGLEDTLFDMFLGIAGGCLYLVLQFAVGKCRLVTQTNLGIDKE